ncbi:tetratricopeptide repeat protein [Pseudomonas sp. HR96]|uniref:tetratricopeptide repeat protein n=1 Tax=Pseudomonas sp. HR96 TaxID=1027966 RepID=UPI002A75101E|nr:tetratricopeptide repeat protein [Pseudomonas sp. HR96]WPO98671.1 tetratricopeptide repeat protein [Pseudomonas sp. HR96]
MNASYLLQLAYQRLQAGHNDGAIDSLRQLLAEDGEHAEAHALLAICLINMRRVHAARAESRLALAFNPELPVAHYAMAVVAMALRQFKSAEQHLRQLLDMEPLNPLYHRTLAELYSLTGRSAPRLEQLHKALELSPNDPANLVAMAQYHRSEGHWEQAEAFAREALQSDPGHPGAVVVLGHLLLRRGDTAGAREHAIWALQENANDRAALHLITAVKARESLFLSFWWRLNAWMSERGTTRAIVILLGMFVLFRVSVIAITQQGYPQVAQVIDWVWLAFVVYTFAAPQIFKRALDKELVQVRLSKEF